MKRLFSFLLLAIGLSSCGKKFLELAPQSLANQDNFYKTAADFNTAIIGAYGNLVYLPTGIHLPMSGYRSDELYLSAPTAGTQDQYDIDRFQVTSANGIITNAWSNYYQDIANCNQIISRITDAHLSDSLTKTYMAEGRFLRALYYFDLVRYWGPVPLVLEPVTPAQSLKIGRTDTTQIYAAIEGDLQYAAQNLPPVQPGVNLGRATSGAAATLLANVYLAQKKFAQAATTLQPLIDGPYQLLATINSVFSVSNKMNAEIIFAVRFNKTVPSQGHDLWFSVSDTSTTPLSASLTSSYPANDKRRALLYYTKVGNNYIVNKFLDTLNTTTNKVGNDYILYRYSDVLLMMAEATNEAGYDASGTGLAWTCLNRVHQRAGLPLLTTTDLPDQNSFRLAVRQERRWELALEGHRWFDLLRTGQVISQLAAGEGKVVEVYELVYPVPQAEIEKMGNTGIFSQNKGY